MKLKHLSQDRATRRARTQSEPSVTLLNKVEAQARARHHSRGRQASTIAAAPRGVFLPGLHHAVLPPPMLITRSGAQGTREGRRQSRAAIEFNAINSGLIDAESLNGYTRQYSISQSRKESLEMRCCRINVLLVTMQLCLGTTVTALGFYMETLSTTLEKRETPYWAGIPTLIAGVLGIYFCATDFAVYQGSTKAFVIKDWPGKEFGGRYCCHTPVDLRLNRNIWVICLLLSTCCVFLCMIGAVFTGIHGNRISSFGNTCDETVGNTVGNRTEPNKCSCGKVVDSTTDTTRVYLGVTCDEVMTSIKDYFILQCALNAIASGVCFWFVILLWKSRHQDFYSSHRYYPYPAPSTPTPIQNDSNSNSQPPPSPICIKKTPKIKIRPPSHRTVQYRDEFEQELRAPLRLDRSPGRRDSSDMSFDMPDDCDRTNYILNNERTRVPIINLSPNPKLTVPSRPASIGDLSPSRIMKDQQFIYKVALEMRQEHDLRLDGSFIENEAEVAKYNKAMQKKETAGNGFIEHMSE